MLEQLNKIINDFLGKFQSKPEYEEVGENLIKEDFSQRGILSGDSVLESIKLPNPEITAIAKDEDKLNAHQKFLQSTSLAKDSLEIVDGAKSQTIEQAANPLPPASHSHAGNVLRGVAFAFGAIVLLGLAYLVFQYANQALTSTVPVSNSTFVFDNPLVRADDTRTMSVEPNVAREVIRNSILQTMYNEDVKLDKLIIVSPSYLRESSQDGKKVYVSELLRADDFLFTFAQSAPLALRTAVSGEYALGMVNATGKSEAFAVISVNEKVAGLRELIRYEQFMYQDLKDTFKLREFSGEPRWKDLTVNNHDFRALTDSEGVVFVYGFATSRAVIFATNVDVFEKVFQRLK